MLFPAAKAAERALDTQAVLGWVVVALALASASCSPMPSAGTKRVVTLDCGTGELDSRGACNKILGVGSQLLFRVNAQTQQVQLEIEKDPKQEWMGQEISLLDGCRVVDVRNWVCGEGDGIRTEFRMTHGHFTEAVKGRLPPDYYHSSISGIPLVAMNIGVISIERAQNWETGRY